MEVESLLSFIINPPFSPLFAPVSSLWIPGVHYHFEGLSLESLSPFRCSYQPANIVGLVVYFPRHCFRWQRLDLAVYLGRQLGLFSWCCFRCWCGFQRTLVSGLLAVLLAYNNLNYSVEENMIHRKVGGCNPFVINDIW